MNLLNIIREEMGYPPFDKVDPNTQETVMNDDNTNSKHKKTGQAAITTVLAGLYQISKSEKGYDYLINKDKNMPWSVELFGDKAIQVVEKISQYGGTPAAEVSSLIDEAGNTAWKKVSERLEGHATYEAFHKLLHGIRTPLLQYLPASLQLGKLLNDSSIDDRTNKMEGPVSGLMHRIEEMF